MKLVIQTQFKENYGAHDWDGTGECPQYWKFKGGSTFVMAGTTTEQDALMIARFVEHADFGSSETIESSTVEQNNAIVCESWETPWNVTKSLFGGEYTATKFTKAEAYWNGDYSGKSESYLMGPAGERLNYTCEYLERAVA
jgi:hypothetical protein